MLILTSAALAQTTWEARFHQGDALEREGQYAAASREFSAALAEAERLGPDDWRLPLTLHNLGAVDRELGRYAEAEQCYRRAIAIWEQRHPKRTLELASSLYNLASLHLVLGRLSRAEPLYRRAYELRLAALGPEHRLTGVSLEGLAHLLQERHRYSEADELYARAAAILEGSFGPQSTEVANISHNRALLYRDQHRDAEALPLLRQAAAIYEKAAPSHPKLAIILRNLAELEASQGDMARAAELFTRAVQICTVSLPPGHPQTGIILAAYGKFLLKANRKDEARAVTAQAQSILAKSAQESGTAHTVDVSAFVR
jgi:tetratricopeptide (TPR) repeat protein